LPLLAIWGLLIVSRLPIPSESIRVIQEVPLEYRKGTVKTAPFLTSSPGKAAGGPTVLNKEALQWFEAQFGPDGANRNLAVA